jgi:hypothetical protein
VEFTDTYTSLLEARLQRTYPGVRVVNLAVGGYNMLQYALVLEEIGMALDPDLILIGVSADNDFALDTYEDNYRVASGQQPPPALAWHESLCVPGLSRQGGRAHRADVCNGGRRTRPTRARPGRAMSRRCARSRSGGEARGAGRAVVLPQTWHLSASRRSSRRSMPSAGSTACRA